ncbi:MAG: hypothetical protein ACO2PN_14630 [Pyrobaculum sp.]|jgi:hypothetical protein
MLRNILIFFYAFIVQLSIFQMALLFGYYSPIGVVLTASAMPYAPPFSVALIVPEPPRGAGWAVAFQNAEFMGTPIKIPVVHYFTVSPSSCTEVIYNSKAVLTLDGNVFGNLLRQLEALLPPWPVHIRTCPYAPAYKVAFVIPAWVFIPLMIFALRYKLYYRFRRVW